MCIIKKISIIGILVEPPYLFSSSTEKLVIMCQFNFKWFSASQRRAVLFAARAGGFQLQVHRDRWSSWSPRHSTGLCDALCSKQPREARPASQRRAGSSGTKACSCKHRQAQRKFFNNSAQLRLSLTGPNYSLNLKKRIESRNECAKVSNTINM